MPANSLLFFFTWYNLPFTMLLLLCGILSALQLIGLGGDQETEGEVGHDVDHDLGHDVDHDLGHDVDHDLDVHHDVDLDHDLAHDLDHDLDHSLDHAVDHAPAHIDGPSGGSSFLNLLAFVGAGKAPLMVVLLLLCGTTGLLGWILNAIAIGVLGTYSGLLFLGVLPLALVGGGVVSSQAARLIARTLPPISTTASRHEALVGRRGIVISPFVDQKFGMVRLRDAGGTLISVYATTPFATPIRRGEEVLLVSYDPARRFYTVAPIAAREGSAPAI